MNDKGILVSILVILLLIAIMIGIGVTIWHASQYFGSKRQVTITVTDKYIKQAPNSDSQYYMIVDSEFNAYKITDDFIQWRFDSTDCYNRLQIGHTYVIERIGWRMTFFSEYPNILNIIEEVENRTENTVDS